MATKAPAKRKTEPQHGEYRTDGKRLVRVLDPGPDGKHWVEDAQTEAWEEIMTSDLQSWKVVRGAEGNGGD
jgi:hypothetical protein